ncbi:MAG TPA: cytochrome oxidase small assembly protein [Methylibium sp.]
MTTPEEKKKSNLRLALILASVALAFFFGFIAKMSLFAHH